MVFVDGETPAMIQRRKNDTPQPPRSLGERLGWICGSVIFSFLVGDILRGGPLGRTLAVPCNMLAAAIAGLAVLQSFMLLRHHHTVVKIAAFGLIAVGAVVFSLVVIDIVQFQFRLDPGRPRLPNWLAGTIADT